MADNREQLKQAYSLIKSGRKSEAARMLAPIVKSDPRNADAWWLMANAVGNDDHKIKALEKVLQLRPDHANAQKMLDALRPQDDLPDPFDDMFDDAPAASAPYSSTTPVYDPYADDDDVADDPFAGLDDDDDDPFAVMDSGSGSKFLKDTDTGKKSKKSSKSKKSGEKSSNQTLYIVLAVVGVLVLFACGGCFIFTQTLGNELGGVMEEVMENVTVNPDGSFTSGGGISSGAPDGAIMRGSIEPGQSLPGNVDTFDDDAWTVNLNSGDTVSVEVTARDDALDPEVFLYAPSGALVAENDDIDLAGGDYNSRVQVTVNETGTFTIVVSAFGSGGPYDLVVRR